ncbi:hypothetical protein Vadar_026264 [Vaccinium darrowii]|uniref:Uncharacterized protein n=1 Tax=Vaccinium darrowii TaxID=229202 RepID=A0ACB7X422_9ERIC|nr:hypothetical protein Vadar_026264 [Vaccinium darrowii]
MITELNSSETMRSLEQLDDQTLNSSLQLRTNLAIFSLANVPTTANFVLVFSLDSLRELTPFLRKMILERANCIRVCKPDTPELRELINEFSDSSSQTLGFETELEKCLERLKDRYKGITDALKLVDKEPGLVRNDGLIGEFKTLQVYLKILPELQKIKTAGDPFNGFENSYQSLVTYLLDKWQTRKINKLHKNLKKIKAWRRVSRIIFTTGFGVLVICSLVAAPIGAPHVAAALSAAAAGPLEKWTDYLFKKYMVSVEAQKKVVVEMQNKVVVKIKTHIEIKELDDIIGGLEKQIESLVKTRHVNSTKEKAVKTGIEEMKKKMGVFLKNVEDLQELVVKCIEDVELAKIGVSSLFSLHIKAD